MKKKRKLGRKLLGYLLTLAMVFSTMTGIVPGMSITAQAAPAEALLTTITPTGTTTYSESTAGVVNVTLSDISRYYPSGNWANGGTVTVTPKEGYTITKCRFNARRGAVDDTEEPFSIDVRSAIYVSSIEVYGYQTPSSSYVDGSGTSQTVETTELETATTNWTDGSWYIVPADGLTISGRITVNGTVNLILRDGATLTANAGITTTNATLNIYAQSAGTGALTATGSNGCAGIGGCVGGYANTGGVGGTVSIFGGTVTATGGNGGDRYGDGAGAGIGGGGGGLRSNGGAGGTVRIFGGTVTATGGNGGDRSGDGAGIGGGGKGYAGSDGASGTLTLGVGVKLYNGTNNSGTVLDGSDSTERSYSSSRPQKMFAEFISVGSVDKTALNNAITTAKTLYDSIKDNDDYTDIANTLKTAIDNAKAVADSDTADQDAVDLATTAITTAKTNAEAAKKDVDDTTAAKAVSDKISELPSKDAVKKDDKTAIDAAKAAFDALTDDQKAKVSDADKQKLNDAVAAIEAAEQKEADDTAAAQNVTDIINALPASTSVTINDKNAIEAARTAYDNLTDDQKAKVPADKLKKLTDAEDALKAAEASDKINALPAADDVTTSDKAAIEAARTAYDALTDAQKAYVPADTLKKLTDAEDKLVVLQVMSEVSTKTGSGMTYTGNPIQLINTPTTKLPEGYKIVYAVTTENKAPTDENLYTTTIPTGTNAGTYYVWYKVAGDENHLDTQVQSVAVTVEPVLFGDVNFDGIVDIADALMISRYDVELAEMNEKQLFVGDVDGDGEVNIADALMISRYDAGLLDKFTRTE